MKITSIFHPSIVILNAIEMHAGTVLTCMNAFMVIFLYFVHGDVLVNRFHQCSRYLINSYVACILTRS
ncbi:hypothetical protein SBF1_1460005 [Candidatus Desulfosporosinus infrequens]|uniref:Uncharacterized protein n=1 Tax=Candidatus Desulfosporosinus infrequens TaxID=2043169 RepID=A0A2U3K6K1_9FIRM|nr:hypothetical protein SBF1_1460005 [Candidatus Desulfosporosinus infrequens]